MTISDLIACLQALQTVHGDLEVFLQVGIEHDAPLTTVVTAEANRGVGNYVLSEPSHRGKPRRLILSNDDP